MKVSVYQKILFFCAVLLLLAGCAGGGSGSGAEAAVERYFQALVSGDINQLVDASCAAWEESARLEMESFTAVSVELEDMTCQEAGQEDDIMLVTCSGTIAANYGNEVLKIDLSERTYKVITEAGELRLCGYR